METDIDMLQRVLAVALASMTLPAVALAATGPADAPTAPVGERTFSSGASEAEQIAHDHIRLAQSGDVQVYFDRRGGRVIVDARTGEILAIERPERGSQRELRRQQRERILRQREIRRAPVEERYYLDDPEDVARLRRDMARERGVYPDDYYDEDFSDAPLGLPRNSYPQPYEERALGSDRFGDEEFGDQDLGGENLYEEPQLATREPVERQPLPDAGSAASDGNQYEGRVVEPIDPTAPPPTRFTARREVAALQVLLDRVGASPGVIDGQFGSNVDKALVAYRELTGQTLKTFDAEAIKNALAETGGDPFTSYTITAEDAAGPYVASVPEDYGQKAKLERLSYTSVTEMLAERFHMDEGFLKQLNPDANFNRPGTVITVANVGTPVTAEVARIVADKGRKQVRAYGRDGKLVAAYPATIGSADTPSPSGTHKVTRIAFDPEYTYNPKLNFKQGNNNNILTIPPGPNGPVGSIWIALDKPTYGIHGTPEPSKIGKTASHGCVRLTNWDAQELAKLVKPDVFVQFIE